MLYILYWVYYEDFKSWVHQARTCSTIFCPCRLPLGVYVFQGAGSRDPRSRSPNIEPPTFVFKGSSIRMSSWQNGPPLMFGLFPEPDPVSHPLIDQPMRLGCETSVVPAKASVLGGGRCRPCGLDHGAGKVLQVSCCAVLEYTWDQTLTNCWNPNLFPICNFDAQH